ncbi:hypothetical protein BH92_21340 [Rhodococcoides fascians A21d2]|uniref:hypothetical protein n=1 Tax=Rhodococcoides fascians TaxID=1828 RepID=UPI000A62B9D0|nr:hypothetical protein [Rhodococcus fascians]QII02070.1 hypothetical protein BH92_21340 [Rhodococcus fascians A21d2]
MFRRTALLAASAAVAFAMTACGNEDAPAAAPTPAPSIAAQIPAPPQVTIANPPVDTTDTAAAPEATDPEQNSTNPLNNTAPITPVDPARYSAYGNQVGWKSPSGNIYCKIGDTEFSSGCQAPDAPVPDGANCVTPSFTIDQLSKGFYMTPGKVTPTCFNQGEFGVENAQTLEYNTSITLNGMTCFSRVEAMICDAGGGHGFVLSMQQATSN